jgi:hypothetical protein
MAGTRSTARNSEVAGRTLKETYIKDVLEDRSTSAKDDGYL